jgi:uncharacterized membrane protein YphA (DoxX/SURF4 family)
MNKSVIWALRLSLAAVYIYSGLDIVRHPTGWYWAIRALPDSIENIINSIGVDTFLRIQGSIELVFAAVLLAWFLPRVWVRIISLFITIQMISILLLVGVRADTFRDIGVLGAGLSLFLALKRR